MTCSGTPPPRRRAARKRAARAKAAPRAASENSQAPGHGRACTQGRRALAQTRAGAGGRARRRPIRPASSRSSPTTRATAPARRRLAARDQVGRLPPAGRHGQRRRGRGCARAAAWTGPTIFPKSCRRSAALPVRDAAPGWRAGGAGCAGPQRLHRPAAGHRRHRQGAAALPGVRPARHGGCGYQPRGAAASARRCSRSCSVRQAGHAGLQRPRRWTTVRRCSPPAAKAGFEGIISKRVGRALRQRRARAALDQDQARDSRRIPDRGLHRAQGRAQRLRLAADGHARQGWPALRRPGRYRLRRCDAARADRALEAAGGESRTCSHCRRTCRSTRAACTGWSRCWWPRWPSAAGPRKGCCARPASSGCARTSIPVTWGRQARCWRRARP